VIKTVVLPTPELGDRSYLLHDGAVAAVIDAQRDLARVLNVARREGVRIACVGETHIHNDYVSGGSALAQQLGVPYLVAAGEAVEMTHRAVRHGDVIAVGAAFSLRVEATPGHTPHHVSYVALENGAPVAVCTGGSMLFGSAGRTDLSGSEQTVPLARRQYATVRRLGTLPATVRVLPTHGFGSFCAVASSATVEASTIAEQRADNLAFCAEGEDAFVTALLAGLTEYPRYYGRMAALNRHGMPPPDLAPPPLLDGAALAAMVRSTSWVVDVRPRTQFARSHLSGTVNIEHGNLFTTYLGWLLPDDTPLVLAGENDAVLADARRDLTRIGIDQLAGRYVGALPPPPPADHTGGGTTDSYPVGGFAELRTCIHLPDIVALDVRRRDEWDAGHLEGALHLALHDLVGHMEKIPPGTVWVHCAAGFRAGIAASLLQRAGRDVVLIDDNFATNAHTGSRQEPMGRPPSSGTSVRPSLLFS
jgi:hydroxyacylglutathione hydrolase